MRKERFSQMDSAEVAFNRFTNLVVARVKTFQPTFLEIKNKMDVGPEAGLGVIPAAPSDNVYLLGKKEKILCMRYQILFLVAKRELQISNL